LNTLFRRIIPKILISRHSNLKVIGGITTRQYETFRFIGSPPSQARIFESNMADEIILINLDHKSIDLGAFVDVVSKVSSEIFMPLSVGGGINSLDQASKVFEVGIEKVVVERALMQNPGEVVKIATRHGSQSLIGSCSYWGSSTIPIPARLEARGVIRISALPARLKLMERMGVGEVMINDASRDGTREGSNLVALKTALSSISLPIIDSCGFGKTQHFVDSFEAGSSAIAIGTYFAFIDQSFMQLRSQLANHGIRVRIK
jgi:imidazole glycerol-phosphate synthase subunit HisF